MCNFFIDVQSTTPEGSPAPGFNPLLGLTQQQPQQSGVSATGSTPAQAVPDTSSILKALADMAKQSTAAAPVAPAQTSPNSVLNAQSTAPAPVSSSVDQTAQQSNGQTVNPYAGNFAAQFAGLSNLAPNMFPSQAQAPPTNPLAQQNPLAALLQQPQPPPQQQQQQPTLTPDVLQQQLGLIQLLAAQGIPQDQWATALQILSLSNNANPGMNALNPAAALSAFGQMPAAQNAWAAPAHDITSRDRDRDRDGHRDREQDYMRSPPNQYRRRSRSPGWDRRREASPPRRRDSPVYGEYHADSPSARNRADPRDARGRRGNDYRQRSPPGRRRRSPTPPRKEASLPPPGPKLIEWDYSIGQGNIKGIFVQPYINQSRTPYTKYPC